MSVARGASALGRPTPSRSARLAVAGLGTALLVAMAGGCTSNAEPSPLPEPTVSASPSPSASPTPPELPAEAEGTSPKAAKAFVRHWVDTLNYATRTGDIHPLLDLSSPDCASCGSAARRIADVYSAGGHIRSDGWSVRTIHVLQSQDPSDVVVEVGIRLSPQTVVPRAGAREQHFNGGRLPTTFYLKSSTASWELVRLVRSA